MVTIYFALDDWIITRINGKNKAINFWYKNLTVKKFE